MRDRLKALATRFNTVLVVRANYDSTEFYIWYSANNGISYCFDACEVPQGDDAENFLKIVESRLQKLADDGNIDVSWFNRYHKRG